MTNTAVLPLPVRTADHTVGSNIKWLIWDRDVEQQTVAAVLGMDQSTLSLKLKGKRKWTVEELVRVSGYFNVTIDWLVKRRTSDYSSAGSAVITEIFSRRPARAITLSPDIETTADILPFPSAS